MVVIYATCSSLVALKVFCSQYMRMYFLVGMEKINFSGGEPFYIKRGEHLGEMVKYCKENLHIESVSVVSNGSRITEEWMQKYGACIL